MAASSDEREIECAGVGHVPGDIEEVLEQPEPARGEGEWSSLAPEADDQHDREDTLANRPAVYLELGAENADEEMARFMEGEVGMVEQGNEARFGDEHEQDEQHESA